MRIASITWNPDSDTTKVTFSDEFLNSDWVVHADVVQDASNLLQNAYDQILQHKKLEKSIKL
jgi:hypothetical protein